MSPQDPPQEPSMEEILASIRRMISEGGGEDVSVIKGLKEKSAAEIGKLDRDSTSEEAAPAEMQGDPFELTQEIQEDGTVVDLKTGETVHASEEPGEPLELEPDRSSASVETGLGLVKSLSALAATIENSRLNTDPISDVRAIEELTREVMRPMIREWLDENLPSLVEGLVESEIKCLTREAEENHQG